MDNPLTPNKIQRLIHLAEDRSFNVPRRLLLNDEDVNRFAFQSNMNKSSANTNCESSSGILDLDKVEGFGESGIGNMSLSKTATFNPGEMTGRSTGTEDVEIKPSRSVSIPGYEEYGRHSLALDSLQSHMDKQTLEINDIMRHSIATNYSFHSKRDLTADEASLVVREAPLPVTQSTQINFQDSVSMNHSNMSVGAYFKNRCPEFGRILAKTDSPDRPIQPSISDASLNNPLESVTSVPNNTFKLDNTLDSIPVRQPKMVNNESEIEKITMNSNVPKKVMDKPNKSIINIISGAKNIEPSILEHENKALNISSISSQPGLRNLNQMPYGHKTSGTKSFMTSSKPTDVLLRNLQSSLRMVTEDTEGSMDSINISKIADYLGKQSNVSVTDMLQLNNQMKQPNQKQPLKELHINLLENKRINQDAIVTQLKDTRKAETASSTGTMKTIISLDKLKIKDENEIPSVIVTQDSVSRGDISNNDLDDGKTHSSGRSKSPSSKSQSTLSTVQANAISFKSGESPSCSRKGEPHMSHIPSPNIGYKELDKSVDWLEVLQQKQLKEECLAKEKWADIQVSPVNGFVGVSCPVVITVSTLRDSWLTARIEFKDLPDEGRDLSIELPRLPLLLSPSKTEQFTLYFTSNIEMSTKLPFTMYLKDASVDGDLEEIGFIELNIKMPMLQAISCDGVNKVSFPIMQEQSHLTKYFVLISDCPVDLKLELVVVDGESMFVIKNVQEVKRSEVSKVLMDRQCLMEEQQISKTKGKGMNRQLCRLTSDNAIKVTITFNSPKLSDLGLCEDVASFKGTLNVNLIGGSTALKRVSITGTVGVARLEVHTASSDKLHISNDPVSITLANTGSVRGCWIVKFQSSTFTESNFPFRVSPTRLEIEPGVNTKLNIVYTGLEEGVNHATLILEEAVSGNKSTIEISGGTDRPKMFPIKTNFNSMSWVRAGRKELSLKNFSDKKVQIRCQILGEGFAIDLPGMESRGVYCLAFGPCECRPLPIVFTPTSTRPHVAALHIVFDKNSDYSRKIKLHGCAEGAGGACGGVRWAGLVTYGDTALVRAQYRSHIDLALYNKPQVPAFVAATVHFNVQYVCMTAHSRLVGARRVIGARARHVVSLRLDWARLPRRAPALATLTVLTGSEYTRRRILRILKSDSATGNFDTSLLPDHLKVLTEQFDGEDPNMEKHLEHFKETKASLNELIESLQELTAQIDLPQDFAEDNTIIISDDTMVEHHTLCD